MTQSILEINNLVIKRDKRQVLHIDRLNLVEKEILSVIGPNGAGKSTLLLTLGRLIKPDEGTITFRGRPFDLINELEYRRRIGLVLQEPLLMNMSVFDNVAIGLRFRNFPSKQAHRQVDCWLEKMGISSLRNRPARSLSGGEAQRTSLARAFALDPELLLLDEPFSSLDAPTRSKLLEDFHAILSNINTTTVFVTHDMDEALILGGRVAVIMDGVLRQVGKPVEVFSSPGDPDIAAFVGIETIIAGEVLKCEKGRVFVKAEGVLLEAVGDVGVGKKVYYCLRPEDITLISSQNGSELSADNHFSGKITRMIPQGPLIKIVLDCGFPLVSLTTRSTAYQMKLEVGMEATASFMASASHLIIK
jgi:ABC-type sulfate/molybdate transport systems ATPase subunit